MKKLILLIVLIYNLLAFNKVENESLTLENNFTEIEKEYIKSNIFTLGMITDNYPFSFTENKKIKGFSYDYINLIMKKSGLKVKIQMDNWSHTLNKFKNKQIDLIDLISYSKKREEFTNFTKPYFEIPNVIFARKNEINNYIGFESLEGKKIGITKDIYYYDVIKSLGLFELIEFEKPKNKIRALAYGKVDAVFHNLISGQKYIKQVGYNNIKILEDLDSKIVKKEDLRIGVRKEDKVLFSIINKSIKAISRLEKESLYNKWFTAKIEKETNKNNINLTNKQKQYLKEKKQITMCIDPDWMPFEKFDKNGKHIGITADYYKIFEDILNIDIKVIKTKTWNESIKNAKDRKCDILSLSMETPKRMKYLKFTTPYLKIPIVVATKVDVPFIDNVDAIENKKVGITKDYAFVEILRNKYPNLNIIEVKNIEDGLKRVNKGELFAYIGTLASISHEFQSGSRGELKIAGKLEENWALGIGVRNDDKNLFNILDKVIKSIDSKKQQKILNNWISIKYEKRIDYNLIWQILIISIMLILFFVYRQFILKMANNNLQIAVEKKTKDLQKLNENLAEKIKEEVEKNLYIQEQLFKSEKMASMGEMIGNIAHQWRQPLSIISTGATGMLMQKEHGLLKDNFFKETCLEINNNAQYLSKTIDDFKNFINGDRKKVIFNLSTCIDSFRSLVKGEIINNNINLILDIQKDISLHGYPNELIQCFINIFNNSKDTLEERNITNKFIFISTLTKDNNVIIKIKDNAGGIPIDILPKIFEPYFTTKHQSKGTGIGLHMTYNLIVKGMDGIIEASNENYSYENKNYIGAMFNITIPMG